MLNSLRVHNNKSTATTRENQCYDKLGAVIEKNNFAETRGLAFIVVLKLVAAFAITGNVVR